MQKLAICIDEKTVDFRVGLPSTGKLSLVVGGVAFPDQDWDDFCYVILDALINAVGRIESTMHESVFFMDGPFDVRLNLLAKDEIGVSCFNHSLGEQIAGGVVTLALLWAELSSAAQALLAHADRHGHNGDDVKGLRTAIATLRVWKLGIGANY